MSYFSYVSLTTSDQGGKQSNCTVLISFSGSINSRCVVFPQGYSNVTRNPRQILDKCVHTHYLLDQAGAVVRGCVKNMHGCCQMSLSDVILMIVWYFWMNLPCSVFLKMFLYSA